MIAAINGIACGGAFYMLGEVDFMIVADHATFFDPHLTFNMAASFEPLQMTGRMPFGDDSGGRSEMVASSAEADTQSFLAGKAYFLGFRAEGLPKQVGAADPWDADYLHVATKDLIQAAFVLRARGLVEIKDPPGLNDGCR